MRELKCPDCDRQFSKSDWENIFYDGEFWKCPECDGVFSMRDLGADPPEVEKVLMEFNVDD